ncbi:MAG: DUF2188 domain-containing protein [Allosphingosinicella sp.]
MEVAPRGDGWQIKREGASRASKVFESKADAIGAAKQMMRREGGLLRLHAGSGRVHEQVTIGRKAAAKISAVEGIVLDKASKRELASSDRDGMSVEERLARLSAAFGSDPKRPR